MNEIDIQRIEGKIDKLMDFMSRYEERAAHCKDEFEKLDGGWRDNHDKINALEKRVIGYIGLASGAVGVIVWVVDKVIR